MNKPIKQVIIVRTDLNMRKGKMVAQGAHASIMFLTYEPKNVSEEKLRHAWLNTGMTKICIRADTEDELIQLWTNAVDQGLTAYLVTDAGRTEFGGVPTKTALAIGPNYVEDIDKITGDLKLL